MNNGLYSFPDGGSDSFNILMGATNEASLDGQLYITGRRLGLVSGTSATATPKAPVLHDGIVTAAAYSNRTANFFSNEDVIFNLNRYDKSGLLISISPLYTGPINGAVTFQTMWWMVEGLQIFVKKGDGVAFTWIGTWSTNPSQMDHDLELFVKKI